MVPCERELGARGEDADFNFDFGGVGIGGFGEEDGLGEVEFAGYGEFLVVGETGPGGDVDDCEWIARETGVGEDVEGCVFELGHCGCIMRKMSMYVIVVCGNIIL